MTGEEEFVEKWVGGNVGYKVGSWVGRYQKKNVATVDAKIFSVSSLSISCPLIS